MPPCPAPFVIVCQPRTGSYHLASLLDSAPDLRCEGEVFKAGAHELSPALRDALPAAWQPVAARDADPMGFLGSLRGLSEAGGRALGFKLFVAHLQGRAALRPGVLQNPGWRKLFLWRDPLSSYASLCRARQTDIWTLRRDRERPPEALLHQPARFEPADFEEHMARLDRQQQMQARLQALAGNPVLAVHQETLNAPATQARLLAFLGSRATPGALQSHYLPQYAGTLEAGFANWGELQDWLARRPADAPGAALLAKAALPD